MISMVKLTLPEINSSHVNIEGRKTILSFWDGPILSVIPTP